MMVMMASPTLLALTGMLAAVSTQFTALGLFSRLGPRALSSHDAKSTRLVLVAPKNLGSSDSDFSLYRYG